MELVNSIKRMIKKHSMGNTIILDMNGIVLDTCDDVHDDNLSVIELILTKDNILKADTNWGIINLEETIEDKDDWYTIEDVLKDVLNIN